MNFSLIYVSEKPSVWAEQACAQYVKRLPVQLGFKQTRIPPLKRNKNSDIQAVRTKEWASVKENIPSNASLVLLDERGKHLSSERFAGQIEQWQTVAQDVVFVIAGADGVNETDRDSVDYLLALSQFTLPHELARVLFIEQLYRAWTILTKHPYHRS